MIAMICPASAWFDRQGGIPDRLGQSLPGHTPLFIHPIPAELLTAKEGGFLTPL